MSGATMSFNQPSRIIECTMKNAAAFFEIIMADNMLALLTRMQHLGKAVNC